MKNLLLGSACAMALCGACISPAAAGGVSGTLSGSYANVTNAGGADIFGVNGSVSKSLSDFSLEGDAAYHDVNGTGFWNVQGNVFADRSYGRIAASVGYHGFSSLHFLNFGGGIDWFVCPNFTFSGKAGVLWDTGSGGSTGAYGGVQGAWYVIPDVSVSGAFDYVASPGGGDVMSYTLKAEWLVSETTPVSVYGGWQHIDAGSADILFAGVKFYLNADDSATLVDRQRHGELGYLAQSAQPLETY